MDYTFTNFESDVSSFITLKKDIISLVNHEKKKSICIMNLHVYLNTSRRTK